MGKELRVKTRNFAVSILGSALAMLLISPSASAQNGSAPRIVTWNCSGCHGVHGNAQQREYPRLSALDAGYIEQRMTAFQAAPAPPVDELVYWLAKPAAMKKVKAASTPEARADMVGIAHAANPQESKAAAAWYAAQKPGRGQSAGSALIESGKGLFANGIPDKSVMACAGCHGAQGEGSAAAPRLGGQNREYLATQLHRFRAGDRVHPTEMTSSSTRFDGEQIRAIAAYLASQ
jgi:cytochrome c553